MLPDVSSATDVLPPMTSWGLHFRPVTARAAEVEARYAVPPAYTARKLLLASGTTTETVSVPVGSVLPPETGFQAPAWSRSMRTVCPATGTPLLSSRAESEAGVSTQTVEVLVVRDSCVGAAASTAAAVPTGSTRSSA